MRALLNRLRWWIADKIIPEPYTIDEYYTYGGSGDKLARGVAKHILPEWSTTRSADIVAAYVRGKFNCELNQKSFKPKTAKAVISYILEHTEGARVHEHEGSLYTFEEDS